MADALERLTRVALHVSGFRSETVPTRAGDVHVLVGEGGRRRAPPVVFLHGLGAAGVHFRPVLHRVRPAVCRVYAPDMPCHGFSATPSPTITPELVIDALFDGIDRALDEPAVFVGNSMGGLAALRYALRAPERVRGLVLCSPAGALTEETLAQVRRVFDLASHRDALDFIDRLVARRPPLRHAVAWGMRRRFRDPSLRALLASVRPEHGLSADELGSLEMPILCLWGAQDRILPESNADFFRASLPPHARFERPSGMGHSPYLDRPGLLSRRIVDFVAALDR